MKRKEAGKTVSAVMWIGMLALAVYIVIKGLSLDKGTVEKIMLNVQQQAVETYLPGVTGENREGDNLISWAMEKAKEQIPVLNSSYDSKEISREDVTKDTWYMKPTPWNRPGWV